MKHQWLAYVVVGLLSIGAGVAIAGLPDNTPVDATISPPDTSDVTDATDPDATTTLATPPVITTPDTTTSDTTTPIPESTTSETTAPASTAPETSEPATPESTDPEVPGLPDRGEIAVAAANGANLDGAAQRMAARLEATGYVDVLPLNGSDIFEFTIVYFADGFDDAALRLASDLELLPEFVGPLEDAPVVADLPADTELLVYVGIDRR